MSGHLVYGSGNAVENVPVDGGAALKAGHTPLRPGSIIRRREGPASPLLITGVRAEDTSHVVFDCCETLEEVVARTSVSWSLVLPRFGAEIPRIGYVWGV